ncbi:Alpha/Beta hydrolase protein [Phyllosticta citribraziliensis]|uniref:Kynurenine formamidase n=1 Tax=Phyllosticta citribraziliensis TaxID=989973 RepID=A0ABR1LMD0_9PEZI
MAYPLYINDIPYATHSRLNTLDIWLPRPLEESPEDAVWVVYIHGGAWRDPLIAASSIQPTIAYLLRNNSPSLPHIAGIASLHYRLSPYPTHPTHPTRLPPDTTAAALEGRAVAHPAHRDDVLEALAALRRLYAVGSQRPFVLLGHSCGATLALQVLPHLEEAGALPRAVAGISGIYDVPRFAANHGDVPVYAEILAGAFGGDGGSVDDAMRAAWAEASPVRVAPVLKRLQRVVLAQSRVDGLVEWEQVELMRRAAEEAAAGVRTVDIKGQHDECWETGEGVALVVEKLLEGL